MDYLKAADFGFYSDDDQAGDALTSGFQQRGIKNIVPTREETYRNMTSDVWTPEDRSNVHTSREQTYLAAQLHNNRKKEKLREKGKERFRSSTDASGAKGQYGISVTPKKKNKTFEDAAVTNLAAHGHDYDEPKNPYDKEFQDEFRRRTDRQAELIEAMRRLIAEGKHDTPEFKQLDKELEEVDPWDNYAPWRQQLQEKGTDWQEGEGRKQAIGEADEKIIPDLVNTNVHEVGHNATKREIIAAIDAEEGLTPEEKEAKKKYANEYAAFTMGDFSDASLAYDEDGNPLDQEDRWKNVVQSRQSSMEAHPDTWAWANYLRQQGGQQ